jgi:hypothetical protein
LWKSLPDQHIGGDIRGIPAVCTIMVRAADLQSRVEATTLQSSII